MAASSIISSNANAHPPPEVIGRRLFNEPQGPHDVACSTCHIDSHGQKFGVTHDFIQWLIEHRPNDPIFNPLNSNDAVSGGDPSGPNFSQLRDNTAVMVRLDLPGNVIVINWEQGAPVFTGPSDAYGLDQPDGPIKQIGVFRNIQRIANVALADGLVQGEGSNALLLWDGRAASYKDQAEGAFKTHAGVTRVLTAEEAEGLKAFQEDKFLSGRARKTEKNLNYTRNLPSADDAIELAGKTAFIEKCMQCHGGRDLNRTSDNHVVENAFGQPHGNSKEGNFGDIHVGDPLTFPPFNLAPNNTNPAFTLMFVSTDPITGEPAPDMMGQSYRIVVTSDPASLFTDLDAHGNAQPCLQQPANCIINTAPPGSGLPSGLRTISRIPSLWDFGELEDYNLGRSGQFHGLGPLLTGAYVPLFQVTGIGLNRPDLFITPQEVEGLKVWMRKL